MASQFAMDYSHTWVSGMVYVNQEDLSETASMRQPIECEMCEDTYPPARVCPNGPDVAWLDEVSA